MTPCFRCQGQVLQFADDLGPRCAQCGQTASPPQPAPAKNGTWMEPNMWYGQREKLLPRIDQAIESHRKKERNANR